MVVGVAVNLQWEILPPKCDNQFWSRTVTPRAIAIAIVVAIVFVFYRCFPFLRLLAFVYLPPRCDNQLESQEPSTDLNLT